MGPPLNQIEFNLGTWDPTKHKATFGNGNLSLYLAVRTVNNQNKTRTNCPKTAQNNKRDDSKDKYLEMTLPAVGQNYKWIEF